MIQTNRGVYPTRNGQLTAVGIEILADAMVHDYECLIGAIQRFLALRKSKTKSRRRIRQTNAFAMRIVANCINNFNSNLAFNIIF
jgi:hypothetical protein